MKLCNIVLIIALIIFMLYFFTPEQEKFSTSGLNMSDEYCEKLAAVYYKPRVDLSADYMNKICGYDRRHSIDFNTGNYFTEYGQLV